MATTEVLPVNPAVAGLAGVLRELHTVVERHGVDGFTLMFAPQGITLPEGYVLVQQVNAATGVITLVPTPINECDLDAVVQGTQEFDLRDRTFIEFAGQPGRTHGCTVGNQPTLGARPGRVHTHAPR